MTITELEAELAHYESRLGKLQAEIMQSNGILERVQVKEKQKQQELLFLSQQLSASQETLLKAEKLTNTSHAFVKQALQNNGQISPQVLAKLHLLDVAHQQILTSMSNAPPIPAQTVTAAPKPAFNQQVQTQQPIQSQSSVQPRSGIIGRIQEPRLRGSSAPIPTNPDIMINQQTNREIRSSALAGQEKVVTEETEDNYEYFGLTSF